MRVGDEFTIRIPGPWDGPVRAVEVDATSFGFVTLEGHLEAGRIRFGAASWAPGASSCASRPGRAAATASRTSSSTASA